MEVPPINQPVMLCRCPLRVALPLAPSTVVISFPLILYSSRGKYNEAIL